MKKLLLGFLYLFLLLPVIVIAQPTISGFNPTSGAVGSTVIINGTGFSPDPAGNIVNFGSARATVNAATATSLTVVVPAGYSQQPITVNSNGLTGFAASPFIVTFPGGGSFNTGSFEEAITIPVLQYPAAIAAADFDGDNKPDIVTLHPYNVSRTISVLKNAGSNNIDFSNRTDLATNLSPGYVNTSDIDGDGKVDIVITNLQSDSISVFKNTSAAGTISFAPQVNIRIFSSYQDHYAMTIAEIDGDGKPDILIVNGSKTISVLRNTSSSNNLSFAAAINIPTEPFASGIAVADININGKADILTKSGTNLAVLNNTSSPGLISFDAPLNFNIGYTGGIAYVATGNLDNDNLPDVAISIDGSYADNKKLVTVLKNTSTLSTISFAAQLDMTMSNLPGDIRIADIDGDGKNDIACSLNDVNSKGILIYRNIGTTAPAFEPRVQYVTSGKTPGLSIADFTGDGKLDMVSVNYDAGSITIFRNKIGTPPQLTSFTPTSAGEATTVTIKGKNLAGVTTVAFGGIAGKSVSVVSDSVITVKVGAGASGNLTVTTAAGTAALAGFTFIPRPGVISFSPLSGPVGQQVKISGTNFSTTPAANIVYFGKALATVTSATATSLTVIVPPYATYDPVSVTTSGYTVYSRQAFNITFPNGYIDTSKFKSALTFYHNNSVSDPNGDIVGTPIIADMDGDGKTDLVVSSGHTAYNNDSVGVFLNTTVNGIVSFKPTRFYYLPDNFDQLKIADFDGDGKLDILALSGYLSDDHIYIFKNKSTIGNILFQRTPAVFSRTSIWGIETGDVDGDGKPDLIVSLDGSSVQVLRNTSTTGTISFENPVYLPLFQQGYAVNIAIGDVDGDGKADIMASMSDTTMLCIFKNTSIPGEISMQRTDIHTGHYYVYGIKMGDLDADGNPDIIAAAKDIYFVGNINREIIFRNKSTPGTISLDTTHLLITKKLLQDFDGDRKPDILVEDFSITRNASTIDQMSFTGSVSYLNLVTCNAGPYSTDAVSGDLNGDGKPDIVVLSDRCDPVGASMQVFINQNSSEKALCPNGDTSIYADLTGTVFQWQVNTGIGYTNIADNVNYSGVNQSVLHVSNIPSSWYGYKYRCMVNGKSSNVTTLQFVNRWTGAINSSWENPGNWSCGTLPDNNTDVIISSGPVVLNSNVSIRSLKLDADVSFTVNPGYTITVSH